MPSRGANRETTARLRFEAAVAAFRCAGELRRIAGLLPPGEGHVASTARLLLGLAQALAQDVSPIEDKRRQ